MDECSRTNSAGDFGAKLVRDGSELDLDSSKFKFAMSGKIILSID